MNFPSPVGSVRASPAAIPVMSNVVAFRTQFVPPMFRLFNTFTVTPLILVEESNSKCSTATVHWR
jgi:hypothetical protein